MASLENHRIYCHPIEWSLLGRIQFAITCTVQCPTRLEKMVLRHNFQKATFAELYGHAHNHTQWNEYSQKLIGNTAMMYTLMKKML